MIRPHKTGHEPSNPQHPLHFDYQIINRLPPLHRVKRRTEGCGDAPARESVNSPEGAGEPDEWSARHSSSLSALPRGDPRSRPASARWLLDYPTPGKPITPGPTEGALNKEQSHVGRSTGSKQVSNSPSPLRPGNA